MTKQLILLRHGRTGLSGRYVGSSDVGLVEEGREQIIRVRSSLVDLGISEVMCSPMLRCRQSNDLLDLGVEVVIDNNLREIDFGGWEKKTFAEIVSEAPGLVDEWAARPAEFAFPNGDSIAEFTARVKAVQRTIVQSSHNKILVISHGGVIRLLICLFLSLHADNYLLFKVAKGKFATLELFDKGGVLTGLNQV